MATIQDIARKAGVSMGTVSCVLNGARPSVRRDAIARAAEIRRIAKELNYRPNTAARAISRGRFGAIGVLASTHAGASGLHPITLWTLQDQLAKHKMSMTMAHIPDATLASGGRLPQLLREWSVDGLLVNIASHVPPELEDNLARTRVPAVWLDAKRERDALHLNERGSAYDVTRQLLDWGHRRIAYLDIAGSSEHYSVADRREGYAAAILDAGLVPRVINEPKIPRDVVDSARNRAREPFARSVLSGADRPTAIVANDAEIGRVFVAAARSLGLSCPGDLAFVGFSDHVVDAYDIDVASVCKPTGPMGRAVIDRLIERMEKRHPLPSCTMPHRFFPGHTFAPPGGAR